MKELESVECFALCNIVFGVYFPVVLFGGVGMGYHFSLMGSVVIVCLVFCIGCFHYWRFLIPCIIASRLLLDWLVGYLWCFLACLLFVLYYSSSKLKRLLNNQGDEMEKGCLLKTVHRWTPPLYSAKKSNLDPSTLTLSSFTSKPQMPNLNLLMLTPLDVIHIFFS